jgi:hypothetical protein
LIYQLLPAIINSILFGNSRFLHIKSVIFSWVHDFLLDNAIELYQKNGYEIDTLKQHCPGPFYSQKGEGFYVIKSIL